MHVASLVCAHSSSLFDELSYGGFCLGDASAVARDCKSSLVSLYDRRSYSNRVGLSMMPFCVHFVFGFAERERSLQASSYVALVARTEVQILAVTLFCFRNSPHRRDIVLSVVRCTPDKK